MISLMHLIRYYCVKCTYEPSVSLFWVIYTPLDMYMFWMRFDLWVDTTKLGQPCRLDPPTWGSPLAFVSCSLNSVPFCHLVPRPWLCSVHYICVQLFLATSCAPRPPPFVCSHYISDGGFNLSVVAILSVHVLWLPSWFILHSYFK